MAVVGMSEMGKARKRKRTLGRFCLSWEDLCGVGFFFFFCYFGLGFLVFGWLLVWSFWGGLGLFLFFVLFL